ncbi:hypothetical protein CC1G_05308 [Coprinopsis cinerea okayama7|uniref:Uncharacterized protein n=1 Tax=Coprinopsis cinerea (strain Okayama-7 / 130 / ATCC MYA-4618 / FGSC 9003) TaxID=240176 RepID=A8PCK5_COPC7|nr:hypothetical protein CC1G_05308 [Coprinopsis cinerea okayama7\|eukprot:XP_001840422.1 hypothetical protein CC1G_05308 [Coprinopsis cinerea okayama7\
MPSDSENTAPSSSTDVEDFEFGGDEEETVPPPDPSEFPSLLEGLESKDNEVFSKSIDKFDVLYSSQEDVFTEAILPHVARFLKFASNTDERKRQVALVDLATKALLSSDEKGRELARANLQYLAQILIKGDDLARHDLLRLFETLLEHEEAFEEQYVGIFKEHVFATPVDNCPSSTAMETFQTALTFYTQTSGKVAVKAGGVEFAIGALDSPDPQIRVAAINCLANILSNKDELYQYVSEAEHENPVLYFHGILLLPILALLRDKVEAVVAAVLDFLQGEDSDYTTAFILADDNAPHDLVLLLAKKDVQQLGAPIDWLLARLTQDERAAEVVEGFRKVWQDEEVDMETKVQVLRASLNNFDTVTRSSLKGGLGEFFVGILGKEEHRTSALTVISASMENHQRLGYYLVKAGAISALVDIFENGTNLKERCLAATILSKLPDTYEPKGDDESEQSSYRSAATAALSTDEILPRILTTLESDDVGIASAAFTLLAAIMTNEVMWSDDDGDDDIPSPVKDKVVTPQLIELALGKLSVPAVAPAALQVLVESAWQYNRGFALVRDAFKPHVPKADATFFELLDGPADNDSRYRARKRRHLAGAVVNVGGLLRIQDLLEEPVVSIDARRSLVVGFRALLCTDVADLDVGRQSKRLPVLLAELLADGTYDSLRRVMWMVRLLSVEGNARALASWTALGTEETINHLVKFLQTGRVEIPEPSLEGLGEEEYEKTLEEHRKKVKENAEHWSRTLAMTCEIIDGLLESQFSPFLHLFAGALLKTSNSCDETCVLELLDKVAKSCDGHGDDALEPFIVAIKDLLGDPCPPTIDQIRTWAAYGSGMSTVLYLGGVVPFLVKQADPPVPQPSEEEDDDRSIQDDGSIAVEVIDAFVAIATKVSGDRSRKRDVQAAFFSTEKLLSIATDTIKNLGEYEKYSASDMACKVFRLSQGYTEALPALRGRDIFPSLLTMFDDDEIIVDDCARLLGWLADVDRAALVDVLKKQIAQLQPPANTQNQGGKKKKKKGRYTPRLSKKAVLERLKALAETSNTAQEAVVEAGGVELAMAAASGEDEEVLTLALGVLRCVCNPEAQVDVLSRLVELWTDPDSSGSILYAILELLQDLIRKYDVQPLLDAEWDRLLVTKLSEEPAGVQDMSTLVATVAELALKGDSGKRAIVERFRERFDDGAALERESDWGTSHALRCLAMRGDECASLVVEMGSIDYAIQLLLSDDPQYITKGAALCTTIVRQITNEALPLLQAKGVLKLVAEGRRKFDAALDRPFDAPEGLEGSELETEKEEYLEKQGRLKDYIDHWDMFDRILGGEFISEADYEEYQWF